MRRVFSSRHGLFEPDHNRPGDDAVADVQLTHVGDRGNRPDVAVGQSMTGVQRQPGGHDPLAGLDQPGQFGRLRSSVGGQSVLTRVQFDRVGPQLGRDVDGRRIGIQKQSWMPPMQKGEKLGCFGLTEPGFGSNPGGMLTRARKVGNEYILNGEKMWITSGTIADVAIIWAKVENEDNKIRGFLVETNRPGFSAKMCQHSDHRRTGAEDRSRDAEDQELRAQEPERDQGNSGSDGPLAGHEDR